MPVDSLNRELEGVQRSWKTVEDCVTGSRAVKGATTEYLPMTTAHEKKVELYDQYIQRALFVPITRRSKVAFQGVVFRKEPKVDGVDKELLADVTLTGKRLTPFARDTFGKVLSPGRVGILVDAAPEGLVPAPARPYLRLYPGATILDWREETVQAFAERGFAQMVGLGEFAALELSEGSVITTHLRLLEEIELEDPKDPFVPKLVKQIRVIDLGQVGEQVGQVHTLWRERRDSSGNVQTGKWERFGTPVTPQRRALPIPFIPFIVINQEELGFTISEPQLLGMADANISHYRNSADLENARYTLGHPQPYAIGVQAHEKIESGSGMWTIEAQGASFGVLQVADQFSTLEKALSSKEETMASEGARLISRPDGVERTATEAMIDKAAERSIIATMADTTSEGIQEALSVLQWWTNGTGDLASVREKVIFQLNTDFEAAQMTPDDALKWAQMHILGQLSRTSLSWKLRRGEVYPPDWTDEEELAELEKEAASLPGPQNEADDTGETDPDAEDDPGDDGDGDDDAGEDTEDQPGEERRQVPSNRPGR